MQEGRHRSGMAVQDFFEFHQLLPGDGRDLEAQVQSLRPGRQGHFQGGDLWGPQFGALLFLKHGAFQPEGDAGLVQP